MKEYAKYLNETTLSHKIPTIADFEGVHYQGDLTTRPDILSTLNIFPVENDPEYPTPSEPEPGYHLEERYAQSEGKILRHFITVQDPPRNLSLSKRKLMLNLKALGIWEQVKQFMQTTNDYWDNWEASTTLDEQEEMMQAAVQALKTAFQMSDEQVEEIITNSAVE